MKTLRLFGLASIMAFCSTVFSAQNAGANLDKVTHAKWEKLGSKRVDMRADHDVIVVTRHEGFYTKIKFAIQKAPVHLLNANVIFGNGNTKNITFNKNFRPGSSTRTIDLPGNKRVIKKIRLNYKSIPTARGKGIVSAWGRH